MLICSV